MDTDSKRQVVVSVVSHGQGHLVANLLEDIRSSCDYSALGIVVTVNIPEQLPFTPDEFPFLLEIVRNTFPKGYGANHNAAFKVMEGNAFCALNPDIRLTADPFPVLLKNLDELKAGLVAPLILNPEGGIEDSARRAITPYRIVKRLLNLEKGLDYKISASPLAPDWVAGMFLVFSNQAFANVDGFDERYYMYCEDADICARLRKRGHGVWLIPSAKVIHDARRNSRRDRGHMWWHMTSLARFFTIHRTWFGLARASAKLSSETNSHRT